MDSLDDLNPTAEQIDSQNSTIEAYSEVLTDTRNRDKNLNHFFSKVLPILERRFSRPAVLSQEVEEIRSLSRSQNPADIDTMVSKLKNILDIVRPGIIGRAEKKTGLDLAINELNTLQTKEAFDRNVGNIILQLRQMYPQRAKEFISIEVDYLRGESDWQYSLDKIVKAVHTMNATRG